MRKLSMVLILLLLSTYTSAEEDKKSDILGKWTVSSQPCRFVFFIKSNDILLFKKNGQLLIFSGKKKRKASWRIYKSKNKDYLELKPLKKSHPLLVPKEEDETIIGKIIFLPKKDQFRVEFRCIGTTSILCPAPSTGILTFICNKAKNKKK